MKEIYLPTLFFFFFGRPPKQFWYISLCMKIVMQRWWIWIESELLMCFIQFFVWKEYFDYKLYADITFDFLFKFSYLMSFFKCIFFCYRYILFPDIVAMIIVAVFVLSSDFIFLLLLLLQLLLTLHLMMMATEI